MISRARALMGKAGLPLEFTSIQGQQIKLESLLGHPAFIIFVAGFSPPAIAAIGKLPEAVTNLPAGSVRVVGVSLDAKRETLAALLKARNVTWPVAFDQEGAGRSPLVRGLGHQRVAHGVAARWPGPLAFLECPRRRGGNGPASDAGSVNVGAKSLCF